MMWPTKSARTTRSIPSIEALEGRFLLSADLWGSYFETRYEERIDQDYGTLHAYYYITNSGDTSTRTVKVSFYASMDDVIDSEDDLIKTITVTVGAGQTADGGWTLKVDEDSPVYMAEYVGMVIDPDGALDESVTDNNSHQGEQLDYDSISEDWDVLPGVPRASIFGKPIVMDKTLKGSIQTARDIDVYRFVADRDGWIGIDIDCSSLDSYLEVYDSEWDWLDDSDDDLSPDEEASEDEKYDESYESYLELEVEAGQTYYLVVSNAAVGMDGVEADLEGWEGLTGGYKITVTQVEDRVDEPDRSDAGDWEGQIVPWVIVGPGRWIDIFGVSDDLLCLDGLEDPAQIDAACLAFLQAYSFESPVDLSNWTPLTTDSFCQNISLPLQQSSELCFVQETCFTEDAGLKVVTFGWHEGQVVQIGEITFQAVSYSAGTVIRSISIACDPSVQFHDRSGGSRPVAPAGANSAPAGRGGLPLSSLDQDQPASLAEVDILADSVAGISVALPGGSVLPAGEARAIQPTAVPLTCAIPAEQARPTAARPAWSAQLDLLEAPSDLLAVSVGLL